MPWSCEAGLHMQKLRQQVALFLQRCQVRFHGDETQAGEMPQTRSHPERQLEHNSNYRVQASGCNAIVTR